MKLEYSGYIPDESAGAILLTNPLVANFPQVLGDSIFTLGVRNGEVFFEIKIIYFLNT